jgi:hypothetical protein
MNLRCMTGQILVLRRVWAACIMRSGGTDAVDRWGSLRLGRIIHHISPARLVSRSATASIMGDVGIIYQFDDMRGPNCLSCTPSTYRWQSIIVSERPINEVSGRSYRYVMPMALGSKGPVSIAILDICWIGEVCGDDRTI